VRWDSKYDMLLSIYDNYAQLREMALEDETIYNSMRGIKLNLLEEMLHLLKPFKFLRENLCKELSPSIHLIIPIKQKLLTHCIVNENDSEVIKELKLRFCENIQCDYHITVLHKCATFLVPALKDNEELLCSDDVDEIFEELLNLGNFCVKEMIVEITEIDSIH